MSQSPEQIPAPPVGEQVHMPEPSLLPIVNAFGISIAIIGITVSMAVVVAGLLIFAISTIIWIVKARREFDELPAEHAH